MQSIICLCFTFLIEMKKGEKLFVPDEDEIEIRRGQRFHFRRQSEAEIQTFVRYTQDKDNIQLEVLFDIIHVLLCWIVFIVADIGHLALSLSRLFLNGKIAIGRHKKARSRHNFPRRTVAVSPFFFNGRGRPSDRTRCPKSDTISFKERQKGLQLVLYI